MIPIALIFVGAIVGAFINWAIYSWAMIYHRSISPWMKPAEDEQPVSTPERIPIYGWLVRKGKALKEVADKQTLQEKYGSYFWVRPFLIEICWTIGLPLFYVWQIGGGLTGGANPPAHWTMTWFFAHTILIVLMCVATFIDFDEKTIPDQVTITGTLIALVFAVFAPWFRLPEVVSSIAGNVVRSIHHASPNDIDPVGGLQAGSIGFGITIFVFTVWIWSLLPKLPVWYVGFRKSIRFMVAYAMQPKRKSKCDIRIRERSTPKLTLLLLALFVLGSILIPVAWLGFQTTPNWESLYGSFIGMAIGGGAIWTIRIVGTYALQQEAMGFGDVTLMVMVGAFLGWQAVVLSMFLAPFLAIAIFGVQWMATGNKMLPFGPYLCAGTMITLLMWPTFWQATSGPTGIFAMGKLLFVVFGSATVLMALMLLFLAWRKGMFDKEDYEEPQG